MRLAVSSLTALVGLGLAFGCGDRPSALPAPEAAAPAALPAAPPPPSAVAPAPALPGAAAGEHAGTLRWARSIGGEGADAARAVAIGSEGRIAVTGYFSGKASFAGQSFDAPLRDAFLLVLDSASGTERWVRRMGGGGDEIGQAVAFAPNGDLVLTGTFTGTAKFGDGGRVSRGRTDIFLARYAADGTHKWTKVYGGPVEDMANGIAVTAADEIVLTGYFGGVLDLGGEQLPGAGHADLFVAKLSGDGDELWTRVYGADGDDLGRAVAVARDGTVVVCGDFHGKLVVGSDALQSAGNADLLLIAFSPAGEPYWARRFGAAFHDFCVGVAVDAAGHIAFTGSFEEQVDFGGGPLTGAGKKEIFLARYSSSGQHLWSRRFGSADDDIGGAVGVDASGHVYLAGWFWEMLSLGGEPLVSAGKNDIALAKFAPNGDPLWSKRFGGADEDFGRALAVSPDGGVVLVGTYRHPVDFGGGSIAYHGEATPATGDAFAARFGP
jgi:hypothetical protein